MSQQLLLSGGLVFDGLSAPQPGLGVLVSDGRIASVAPVGEFAGYAGARHDTAGATLMPGLVDAHVHLALEATGDVVTTLRQRPMGDLTLRLLENAQATLAGGITAMRDLGGVEWLEMSIRDAVRAGRHIGPSMRCAGKALTITGGHGAWIGIECDGPNDWLRGVRTNVKHGADCIKLIATGGVLTGGVDPLAPHPAEGELAAAVTMAHDFGLKITAHAQGARGIARAVSAGVDSIEHGFELTDAQIAIMIDKGVRLVPTLSAMMALLEMKDRLPGFVRAKAERFGEMHFDSFRRFVAAGGVVAMGTDAGTPGNRHGENAQELHHMVTLGMDPLSALKAGTSVAADLLDFPDRGRIVKGAAADLLLVPGDVVTDIKAAADASRHLALWKDGIRVTLSRVAAPQGFTPASAAGF